VVSVFISRYNNGMSEKIFITSSMQETIAFGESLGSKLQGGEVIELTSDIGGGKTTLVRGVARGIQSEDQVQSPTFTISRIYEGEVCNIHHFDFYRLENPGVMREELLESIDDPRVVVVVEWSQIVEDVLPADRITINIDALEEGVRNIRIAGQGQASKALMEQIS